MSFEQLKNIINFNRSQPDGEKEDIKGGMCPRCWWPLKENENGDKACEICGEIYK